MPWNPAVVDSQILAIHVALVANGDDGEVVLFGGWSAQQEPGGNFRKTRVYDVRTHTLIGSQVGPLSGLRRVRGGDLSGHLYPFAYWGTDVAFASCAGFPVIDMTR